VLKLMFIPFRVLGGVLAGALARALFKQLWSLVDKQEPPDPQQREISPGKLTAALVLEGAVFKAVRGLVDRGSRVAFSRLTGRWPGEPRPKPHGESA
jgi:Protein of unknown function (DUF4235)